MYELTYTERIQYKQRQDTAYQAGQDAVTNLRTALALADLTLPSLSNDGPVAGHGFVRLGGCNAALANQLAEVIAAGADALRFRRNSGTVEQPEEGRQEHTGHAVEVGGYRILRAEVPNVPDPIAAFLLAVRDTTGHPARADRRPMRAH